MRDQGRSFFPRSLKRNPGKWEGACAGRKEGLGSLEILYSNAGSTPAARHPWKSLKTIRPGGLRLLHPVDKKEFA